MAIHIESFGVDGFRGISSLDIKDLNHINIIAGDNNSGKTSVLESIIMFSNPFDLKTLFSVARLRDETAIMNSASSYDGFLNLFAKDRDEMSINGHATMGKLDVRYTIKGELKRVLLDKANVDKRILRNLSSDALSDVSAFSGELIGRINGKTNTEKIEINEYSLSTIQGKKIAHKLPKVKYLSPISHITGNNFDDIIRNDEYKNICIRILQLFDADIVDLLLLKSEVTNLTVEYIKHRRFGNMPLNTYGDGIKKIIALANAIAKSAHGILLIDEVETAIHTKHYNDIFSFISKAAIQFGVQVFITTHSIEAIDSFLETQNYTQNNFEDNISVITFKKENKNTLSRVLTGRSTYESRENFDFEVRL